MRVTNKKNCQKQLQTLDVVEMLSACSRVLSLVDITIPHVVLAGFIMQASSYCISTLVQQEWEQLPGKHLIKW
jgi:hypothetical protein